MTLKPTTELGKLVRERRLEMGLTQAQLARIAGVTQGFVCTVETANKRPANLQNLHRLSMALDLGPRCVALAESMPTPERKPKKHAFYVRQEGERTSDQARARMLRDDKERYGSVSDYVDLNDGIPCGEDIRYHDGRYEASIPGLTSGDRSFLADDEQWDFASWLDTEDEGPLDA